MIIVISQMNFDNQINNRKEGSGKKLKSGLLVLLVT